MAKSILRDQKIYFDGYEITTLSNSVALETSADVVDLTALGATSRERGVGLKSASLGVSAFYDPGTVDAGVYAGLGVADKVITVSSPSDAPGDIGYSMEAVLGEYNFSGSIGEAGQINLNAASNDPLIRGTIMLNSKAVPLTATGDGTPRELVAVSSTQRLWAALHILEVDDAADSITVTIESDVDALFNGSETTRITFAAANAVGAQFLSVPGAITDTFYRVSYTISGSTPSFKALVNLGIY